MRWLVQLLTSLQHANLVDCCEELLKNCNQYPTGYLGRILMGDETWIHDYDPLNQQEAKTWKN